MKVVIVTPNEADRVLSVGFLREEGIDIEAYPGMADLARQVAPGVGCIVLVEEALAESELAIFHQALAAQPPWSDMPLIVIAAQGSTNPYPPDSRDAQIYEALIPSLEEISLILTLRPAR